MGVVIRKQKALICCPTNAFFAPLAVLHGIYLGAKRDRLEGFQSPV